MAEIILIRSERCILDIKKWMAYNTLKLNDVKAEFMVMCPKTQQKKVITLAVKVSIKAAPSLCYLGIIFYHVGPCKNCVRQECVFSS